MKPEATPVTDVRAAAYRIPTDRPESDGTLAWDSTTVVVVEVDAGGRTGLGYTYAHSAAIPLVDDKLAAAVTGRDVHDIRGAWTAMVDALRNVGVVGVGAMAVSAVDIALWDLRARVLDVSLAELLGTAHETVPLYGSGGFTSYDDAELAEQLAGWVDNGFRRVKIKVGRDPARDRRRLHVARKAVGDDVALFTDANGAFRPRQAVEWASTYRYDYGVEWFEEPVTSDDLTGLRRVRDAVPGGIDIAAGEYCWNPWSCAAMLDADAVDCLQIDVTRCLGITGFLAGAATAEARAVDVSAHCAPQLSAHVCSAVRRLRHLEYFHDHVRIESRLFDGVLTPESDGVLRPDRERPGHGLSVRHADAEQFRIA